MTFDPLHGKDGEGWERDAWYRRHDYMYALDQILTSVTFIHMRVAYHTVQ